MQIERISVVGALTPSADVDRDAVVRFKGHGRRVSDVRREWPRVKWLSRAGLAIKAQFDLRCGTAVTVAASRRPGQQVRGLTRLDVNATVRARCEEIVVAVGTDRRGQGVLNALTDIRTDGVLGEWSVIASCAELYSRVTRFPAPIHALTSCVARANGPSI
jgi:hypothetical protein